MDCVLLLLRLRPPALCAPSFPKRLEEEKFFVFFFFFFLRVALHHRVRGRFAKKRIQWLHYSWGKKSLYYRLSQSPGTNNPEKTHNNDDDARQKSPLFFFLSERSSVSSFSRQSRLDFYHVDTTTRKKRNRDVCKKYIKKRTPTRSYYYLWGCVFLVRSQTLSLLKKVVYLTLRGSIKKDKNREY